MNAGSVVLLSGGLDSATCLAIAAAQTDRVFALSFDYNQRHSVELIAAQKIAEGYQNCEHIVLPIDLSVFGGSALVGDGEVPDTKLDQGPDPEIPVTYVPGRNTIFLSCALGLAEAKGLDKIYIGVNALDYSGYPDCRPEYIAKFQELVNLATKAGIAGNGPVIETPLVHLSKAEIIRLGMEKGVDYAQTISCYRPDTTGAACGNCDSCYLRKKGFVDAGFEDPTRYAE